METVRIGLIGLGGNGGAFAELYHAHPNAELAAVCDVRPESRTAASEKFGPASIRADYEEIVALDSIDAVSIHTPDRFHASMAIAALENGKHVFVEKPMGTDIEQIRRAVELSESAGLKLMVGQVLRFYPFYRRVREIVQSGQLGTIFYAEGYYMMAPGPSPERVQRIRETYASGFVCSGTHPFDLLRWYIGEPVEVAAFGNRGMALPELGKDDFVCAIYRLDTGCIAKIAGTFACSCNITNRLHLFGSAGTLFGNMLYSRDRLDEPVEVLAEGPGPKPYAAEVDAFVASVRNDTEPPVSGRDGGNTAIGILSAIEAMEQQRQVQVPLIR